MGEEFKFITDWAIHLGVRTFLGSDTLLPSFYTIITGEQVMEYMFLRLPS